MTNPLDGANPASNLAIARAITQAQTDANNVNVRLGIVVSANSSTAQVAVSGSTVLQDAAYLLSPQYRPMIGDTVVLLRYGASWLVLGATSLSPADNLVFNGSFEIAPNPGDPPTGWTLKTIQSDAGTVTFIAQEPVGLPGTEIDGEWVLGLGFSSPNPSVTEESEFYMYSQPIPVNPGETYAGYGYFTAHWDNFSAPLSYINASLDMGWYADDITTTPLSVSGGINYSGWTTPTWEQLMCVAQPSGFKVPLGANFLRMHLWTKITLFQWAPASIFALIGWDRIVVRKILNADGSIAVVPSA